jgi:hypothetical protein
MDKLIAELERLYFLQGQQWQVQTPEAAGSRMAGGITPEFLRASFSGEIGLAFDLPDAQGRVRTMVIDFARAADWDQVATLYQVVQDDLELPAPAIAISAQAGYQLWFSLAGSVPLAQAQEFLHGLYLAYLPDFPLRQLSCYPPPLEAKSGATRRLDLVPAMHRASGKWSAFIDPTMGAMFIEAPGLEMAPNMDRQADILSRLASIKADDFQQALSLLQSRLETTALHAEVLHTEKAEKEAREALRPPQAALQHALLSLNQHFSDPQSFLLAVMNDASASADQRIKAARALLPFFSAGRGE